MWLIDDNDLNESTASLSATINEQSLSATMNEQPTMTTLRQRYVLTTLWFPSPLC